MGALLQSKSQLPCYSSGSYTLVHRRSIVHYKSPTQDAMDGTSFK